MELKDLLYVNTSTHYQNRFQIREEIECEEVDDGEVPDDVKVALGIELKDNKCPET